MKKICLALPVLAILAFVLFDTFVYMPYGLENFSKDQFEPAWETAAKGFCASSGLAYSGRDFLSHRAVDSGKDDYVWGVARGVTPDGQTRLSWIYLEWSSKRHVWTRSTETVLADDDDRIYYTLTFPGQARCAWYAITKLLKEFPRHVREYMSPVLH